MKILMVNKFLYPHGGAETYIFELGRELAGQGHTVEYFGMEHENRTVGNRAESYTANMDFHTGKLRRLFYPFRIIYSFEARKKIRAVLEDFQPDVVHLNNFNFQLTPSILYEIKAHKVPVVFTAHDYQLICPNHLMVNGRDGKPCEKCPVRGSMNCAKDHCIHGSLVKSLLGTVENKIYGALKTYRLLDRIICPSRFMADKLALNGCLRDRLVVMHNFIPEMSEKQVEKEGYVLYFGRYSKEKGIETLMRACEMLPQIPFVFAGKGDHAEEIRKIPNVKEIGFLQGEELYDVIRRAAFTVYPSEWYENCPFSVMESQALGTPVIGTDMGGIPELISRGRTGEIVAGGNKEELARAIGGLWSDQRKYMEYAGNCKEQRFDSCREYTDKLVAIYRELM